MYKKDERLVATIDDPSIQPRKSVYRQWNQMPRCQRKLILLLILVNFMIFFLILLKLQSTSPAYYQEDEVEKKDDQPKVSQIEIHVQISPFGKKQDQLEEDKERKDLQQYLSKQQEELNKLYVTLGKMLVEVMNNVNLSAALKFKGPQNERQTAVVEAFQHAWSSYKKFAWGHDMLKPFSEKPVDSLQLGLTIVHSLDTMYIMKLSQEFEESKTWIEHHLNFNIEGKANLHDIIVHVFGGLLSAYHLTDDEMIFKKANELGSKLLSCFDPFSAIPNSVIDLKSEASFAPWANNSNNTALNEVTSIQMEFNDLSSMVDNKFVNIMVQKLNKGVHKFTMKDGLARSEINSDKIDFDMKSKITIGGKGDSYYETLLKQWIQNGRVSNSSLIEDYKAGINGIIHNLVRTTPHNKLIVVGELLSDNVFNPVMEHTVCHLPGTLLLGYFNGMPITHLHLAEDLLETCYQMYVQQPTFLAGERITFNMDDIKKPDFSYATGDAFTKLRPDFIESLYYFYALTGKAKYQEMGWLIFKAIEKYAKVPNGYSSLSNVSQSKDVPLMDTQEPLFMGETLKYFYLLFSPNRNEIDLDKFVFTSAGHLLPIEDHSVDIM